MILRGTPERPVTPARTNTASRFRQFVQTKPADETIDGKTKFGDTRTNWATKMSLTQVMEAIRKRLESKHGLGGGNAKTAYAIFHEFDRDGSGVIEKKEIGSFIKRLGIDITPSQLQDVLVRVDLDGSGTVSMEELMQCFMDNTSTSIPGLSWGVGGVAKPTAEKADQMLKDRIATRFVHLNDAFLHFDTDRNGKIDKHEMHRACNRAGIVLKHEEMDRLMDRLSVEKGGGMTNGDFLHHFGAAADGSKDSPTGHLYHVGSSEL
jgi:Ca2+-binding EF-hand superfamily protein